MTSSRKPKSHEFLSPAGAGIVLICFFLPWLRVSCGAKKMTLAGPDLGGVFYIVLATAAAMLVACIVFWLIGRISWMRPFLILGSLAAISIIAYKSIRVALDPNIPFYIPEKMIGFEFKTGAFGTVVGLLLWFGGALLPRDLRLRRKKPESKDSQSG